MIESVTLSLQNERHSKLYRVALVQVGKLFAVNFEYGSTSSALTPGTKTKEPVQYEQAKKIYDRLVQEKTGKACSCCGGVYTPKRMSARSEDALNGYTVNRTKSETEAFIARSTEELPIPKYVAPNLEVVTTEQAQRFLTDDRFGMMRKHDGQHRPAYKFGTALGAINKLGGARQLREEFARDLRLATKGKDGAFIVGEEVGSVLWVYDLLEFDNENLRKCPFAKRYALLEDAFAGLENIRVSPLYLRTKRKTEMLKAEIERRAEGVVFVDLSAPVNGGKWKLKFVAEASFRVCKKPGKRATDGHNSFAVELMNDAGDWIYCGTVTGRPGVPGMPPGESLPKIGQTVDCRYLYVGAGQHLFQPRLIAVRDDVDPTHLTVAYQKLRMKEDPQ